MGLRESILSADDGYREPVTVPEWGGVSFFLRALPDAEREQYLVGNTVQKGPKKGTVRAGVAARLLVLCAVDEAGQPVFKAEDAAAIARKSGAVVARLFDICRRINNIGDDWQEEELKNSAPTPGSASSTA
jgi:hypothetical protein